MNEQYQKQGEKPVAEDMAAALSSLDPMSGNPDGLYVHGEKDVFFHVRKPRRVHWSVAWSDLMMTMFILFAVLFIYQSANREFQYDGVGKTDAEQAASIAPRTTPADDRVPDETGELRLEMAKGIRRPMDTFRLASLAEVDQVELMDDQAVRIILPGDLLFDTGRAELKGRAISSLGEIAGVIRRTEDHINVVGHTDDVPIHSAQFATNWELSATRACQVARFLIEQMKIPAHRFHISGRSYFQPIKPNNSVENRAKNRRVEIILTKKKPNPESGG